MFFRHHSPWNRNCPDSNFIGYKEDITLKNYTAKEWFEIYEQHVEDAGDGKWLEHLVCDLGHKIPEWDFHQVVGWADWSDRETYFPGTKGNDIGIDNVGIRPDGSLVAIQCKARTECGHIVKRDVESFLSAVGDDIWVERWIVSNVQPSNNVAQLQNLHTTHPVKFIDFVNPVRQLVHLELNPIEDDPELTAMQNEAVNSIVRLLKEHGSTSRPEWNEGESRGYMVLPCGTGKTRISYRVMKELVNAGEIAVVLVPSIALVSQIKGVYQSLARRDNLNIRSLAICSDATAGMAPQDENRINLERDRTIDAGFIRTNEVVGETALNEGQVKTWLKKHKGSKARIVLFSTYQSAHNTAKGLLDLGLKAKLMIGDEAHRTAGIRKVRNTERQLSERIRNFTLCHDKDKFPAKYRLYQTATPRIYTKKPLDETNRSLWEVRSMNDESTFGYELFRLQYSEAVDRNLLSDYRIIAWAMGDEETDTAHKLANELNENTDEKNWTTSRALRALGLVVLLAGGVPSVNIRSVIAFCNRIRNSSELTEAVKSETVRKWLKNYLNEKKPKAYRIAHVDASHRINFRNDLLNELAAASEEKPYCISNVGIFGEGTDSPDLSAVAFLEPRKSPVDVVQAVGRIMRKSSRKRLGYIFVPIVIPPSTNAEHFLKHSTPDEGWKELGQILQALRAHDCRIEDQLSELMEIYLPSQSDDAKDHFLVIQEPRKKSQIIVKTTRQNIENVVAGKGGDDNRSILERLTQHSGKLVQVSSAEALVGTPQPYDVHAVRRKLDGTILIGGYSTQFSETYARGGGIA